MNGKKAKKIYSELKWKIFLILRQLPFIFHFISKNSVWEKNRWILWITWDLYQIGIIFKFFFTVVIFGRWFLFENLFCDTDLYFILSNRHLPHTQSKTNTFFLPWKMLSYWNEWTMSVALMPMNVCLYTKPRTQWIWTTVILNRNSFLSLPMNNRNATRCVSMFRTRFVCVYRLCVSYFDTSFTWKSSIALQSWLLMMYRRTDTKCIQVGVSIYLL